VKKSPVCIWIHFVQFDVSYTGVMNSGRNQKEIARPFNSAFHRISATPLHIPNSNKCEILIFRCVTWFALYIVYVSSIKKGTHTHTHTHISFFHWTLSFLFSRLQISATGHAYLVLYKFVSSHTIFIFVFITFLFSLRLQVAGTRRRYAYFYMYERVHVVYIAPQAIYTHIIIVFYLYKLLFKR
jgi:hypothetical protein